MSQMKTRVLDGAQIAKPVDVEVKDCEWGVEIVVTRGRETARIKLDYFAGRLVMRQYGSDGYKANAELANMPVKLQ